MQEEKPLTAAEAALRGFAESVPTLLKYATSCAVTILERTADRLLISLDATEDDGRIFDEQWSAYTDRARSLGLVSRLLRVKREGGRMHGAELFVCTEKVRDSGSDVRAIDHLAILMAKLINRPVNYVSPLVEVDSNDAVEYG